MITPAADTTTIKMIAHALTVALGARDHYTRVHCDRVVQLSVELGQHIELTAEELECMQQHVLIGEQIVLAINGGRASEN